MAEALPMWQKTSGRSVVLMRWQGEMVRRTTPWSSDERRAVEVRGRRMGRASS